MKDVVSIKNNDLKINYSIASESFLSYIIEKFYKESLLSKEEIDKINLSRISLLKTQLSYYTKRESSSVMIETAESINKCNDFTIGFYLKTKNNIDDLLNELKNKSIEDMFMKGNKYVKYKVLENKSKLAEIKRLKLKIDNYSYNDTIDYGIPIFFKEYDDFFKAHESPGAIDYQLCLGDFEYLGIEHLNEYLRRLNIEEEFLRHFPIEYIRELLKSYDEKSELLLLNVFELVLTNVFGLMVCDKNIIYLEVKENDIEEIKSKLNDLSLEEVRKILFKKSDELYKILNIKNEDSKEYIKKSAYIIAVDIKNALDLNSLKNTFINFKYEKKSKIIYEDRERLDDESFRKLIEEISSCKSVYEKMKIIKDNIKSLYDMVDMLNAECLYDNDYDTLFESLSKEEFILLFKYVYGEYGYSDDTWKIRFYRLVNSLNEKEIKDIKKYIGKIEFE